MPRRYYFGPVPSGMGQLGENLFRGITQGAQNYEQTRGVRRAERRQSVEDTRRRGFEDSEEARRIEDQEREGTLYEMGLDETFRQGRGGRGAPPPGDPNYARMGPGYVESAEGVRQRGMREMSPALSRIRTEFGSDITPEEAMGGREHLGLNAFEMADPTDKLGHGRTMERLGAEIGARKEEGRLNRAATAAGVGAREAGATQRARERDVRSHAVEDLGEFDANGNWTGQFAVSSEEVQAYMREYVETGIRPNVQRPEAEAAEGIGRLSGSQVARAREIVTKEMEGFSLRKITEELEDQGFTDEEIRFILRGM